MGGRIGGLGDHRFSNEVVNAAHRIRPGVLMTKALVLLIVSTWVAPGCLAEAEGRAAPDPSLARCEALVQADLSNLPDAAVRIHSTEIVRSSGKNPSYCRVLGYVQPQIHFELRLPTSNWNNMFMEVGDGGAGGAMFLFLCDGPLRKGYACIASDMGHSASPTDWMAFGNNAQVQVDFGFRATHVTALAGKAIAESYYGRAPSKSVMFGCSTGGYQGMVEVQRFPWDFDGIVALAPDTESQQDLALRIIWHVRHVVDGQSAHVFSPSNLALLHKAALEKCDLSDGVKDGIVGDPLRCQFDPAVLICKKGQKSECLTSEQVDAARKVYAGPMTSQGIRISTRGVLPGSELHWYNYAPYDKEFFRFGMSSPLISGNVIAADNFDFDRDYQRLGAGVVYVDNNPDLRKFKAAGGKLIVAQGGNDTLEIPGAIFDYYDAVERTMGGRANTQAFFRLFLVPGVNHCSGGDGAFAIDYLTYIEDWIEKGHAPDVMFGGHVDDVYMIEKVKRSLPPGYLTAHPEIDTKSLIAYGTFEYPFPLDPEVPITFTRPVYPYPLYAYYKGKGDPNRAENFKPVGPLP